MPELTRQVVLICGPPGAGKSTMARTLGLTVFDRDDPIWRNERHFLAVMRSIGTDPHAKAVVIRSGASASSRKRTMSIIKATRVVVLDTDADVCIQRVRQRNRPTAAREVAGVRRWWATYRQSVPRAKLNSKYGPEHKRERSKWEPIVAAGQAHCAEPVCVMPTRWIPPGSRWHLCHDPTGTRYIGVGHGKCNERENAVRNNPRRAANRNRWVM